ncbi:protein phosphatase inhibitor IPP2 [Besnoitia besnoiti]|uniref:Protein phosphatase inhibitor IPP2 n=1 Tax=Besnoitia besnoiti TaxID=94643 RepID=A0A2A9MKQ9_BESBE|nr:protein phosphatase inhibitor IPP2 [Besnoitia besnoiti]PFH38539.1 protein phosphatase inhibitor IPP2 [Besnoitia besnoiti]
MPEAGDGNPSSDRQRNHSALRKPKPRSAEEQKHLKWDEEVIAEHDLERGTRMKIDEPPTPYHRRESDASGGDEQGSLPPSDAVCAAALQACLEHLEVNEHGQALNEEELKEKRRHDFEQRRKQHYNEFERVKLMRASAHDVEEEDD